MDDNKEDNNQQIPDSNNEAISSDSLQNEGHASQAINLTAPEPVTRKKFSKKKLLIITIVVLLVVGGGVSAYLLMQKDEKPSQSTPATTQQSQQQLTGDVIKELSPDTIAYAFASKVGDPYGIFWRPATSGDRTDAKLSYTNINSSDVSGQNVVFVAMEGQSTSGKEVVIYSSDGGRNYKKLYDAKPQTSSDGMGEQVTSIKISSDGKKLAMATIIQPNGGVVYEIDLATSSKKEILTNPSKALFIYGYDSENGKLIHTEGCYNCDGNLGNEIFLTDIKGSTKKSLAKSSETTNVNPVRANRDFTEFLVISDTLDKTIEVQDFYQYYLGPPYTLTSVKLSDASSTTIAKFGEKLALNSDKMVPATFRSAGYMSDGKTPYYALKSQLFGLSNPASPTLLFESEKSLQAVYYVSSKEIIASSGAYNDFKLAYFNIDKKSNTNILNGDSSTNIFGVTTK